MIHLTLATACYVGAAILLLMAVVAFCRGFARGWRRSRPLVYQGPLPPTHANCRCMVVGWDPAMGPDTTVVRYISPQDQRRTPRDPASATVADASRGVTDGER